MPNDHDKPVDPLDAMFDNSDMGRSDPDTRRRSERMDTVLGEALARLPDALDTINARNRTRRGEDIKAVIRIIERVWLTFPQLRLSQLLVNAIPSAELDRRKGDIFYLEDDEIVRWLNEFHRKHYRVPTKAPRR